MANFSDFESSLALSRFGLGRRSGDAGGNAYIRMLQEIDDEVVEMPGGGKLPSTPDLFTEVWAWQNQVTAAKSANIPNPPSATRFYDEIDARFNGTMLTAETGLGERLAMFWANHFALSRDKSDPVAAASGAFEREAIRPFLFGRFFDMLLAVETHPAMIYFLDNAYSVGPRSQMGGGGNGLNENLAREILELHTLGVRTGYSQADVTAFAHVLTGWTVVRPPSVPAGRTGSFAFSPAMHEPGVQTLMGRTYDDEGFMQGAHVLRDLASHPATARHIATKLASHFVSDVPPASLVSRLETTFLDSEGDLKAVTRTLLQSDEAMDPRLQKLRLPQEYLAAMQRATGQTLAPQLVDGQLMRLGQPLWMPGGPNGFSDRLGVWATPTSLQARIDISNSLSRTIANPPDPRVLADATLGPLISDASRNAVALAETRPQGLALTFLSPEFMRR